MCWQKIVDWFEHWFGEEKPPPPPKEIQYLVMKANKKAPLWPFPGAQTSPGILKDGDAAVVRAKRNYQGSMWYEVLCGEFNWAHCDTGWIKFKEDKCFLEWRKVESQ